MKQIGTERPDDDDNGEETFENKKHVACWMSFWKEKGVNPFPRAPRDESLTPNQLAELEASNAAQKQLGSERPGRTLERDEFSDRFEQVWGPGWKVGYYAKADMPAHCPFSDPSERRIWNDGLLSGADAREMIEPRPVPKEKEAA